MGVEEARRLIEEHGVRGLQVSPDLQGFFPNDRMAYPLYEVIAEHKLPASSTPGRRRSAPGSRAAAASG